jgi:hypothetical protein
MPNAENAVEQSRKLLAVVDSYLAKFPRERKFTVGDRLIENTITILETVIDAYYGPRN